MYSDRYLRALLERRAKEHGKFSAVARELGLTYQNFRQIRRGRRCFGSQIQRWLGVKRVTIYVPVTMSDEELDARLALARRGRT